MNRRSTDVPSAGLYRAGGCAAAERAARCRCSLLFSAAPPGLVGGAGPSGGLHPRLCSAAPSGLDGASQVAEALCVAPVRLEVAFLPGSLFFRGRAGRSRSFMPCSVS